MQLQSFLIAAVSVPAVFAAVNEPCYGSGGRAGVCVTTSSCSSSGGTTINGACPKDPDNVKCCTKASCGSGGNCRFTSDCAGTSVANQCPGPSTFKCCDSSASGFGGYGAPNTLTVGACKSVAVNGAKKIVAAFPKRVREIFCTRDCTCPGDSDHCCGKATDMMCSDAGGTPTTSGKEIAEWVMNNRATLDLKYVIWGQRIWNPSVDSVKSWSDWRGMEDRGGVTANHCTYTNVKFEIDDIEEPWTYSRPFDYIHSRAMTSSVADWKEYIKKCYDNLNPNGYLELNEIDLWPKSDDGTLKDDSALIKFIRLWGEAAAMFGRPFQDIRVLKDVMIETGFKDVYAQMFKWPSNAWAKDRKHKELGFWNHDNFSAGLESFMMAPLTRAHNWTKEEVTVFGVQVRNDMRDRNIHAYTTVWSIYGRKPGDNEA
ncbi:hypothetical protein K4K53_009713 [Colletotrichum sp. SAR 10_77]|nr:hypothetical protein K4K53_009713 [Colletotrichum sp. SAR 10_77]